MTIVSNTSPITNLATVGQLNLLQHLYSEIIIPQAVYIELTGLDYQVPGTREVQTFSWIQTQQVRDVDRVEDLCAELDPGEAEAIVLAIELNAERLLIDDQQGRNAATRLGLEITGILGILLIAKRRHLISTVKPTLDALIEQANFRVSSRLYSTTRLYQDV